MHSINAIDSMTPNEIDLLQKAACDLATGNHLLRKRTNEELAMLNELCRVLNLVASNAVLNEHDADIYEEYRLCTDYEYAKSKGKA